MKKEIYGFGIIGVISLELVFLLLIPLTFAYKYCGIGFLFYFILIMQITSFVLFVISLTLYYYIDGGQP